MESLERQPRRLAELLVKAEPGLVAVLPQNTVEFSYAASLAGADAVVVGIDKTETSLPGLFGSFDLMEDSINSILSTSSTSVGISIGDSRPLTREEWERIVAKPFGFVNMYAHHMPPFVLHDPRIEKLVSIGPGYMLEQVRSISEIAEVTALEAAIVPPQGRSHVFNALDLATLSVLAGMSAKPVYVRTQKKMTPDDVASAFAAGLRGMCFDPAAYDYGIEAYRDAISTFSASVTRPAREG